MNVTTYRGEPSGLSGIRTDSLSPPTARATDDLGWFGLVTGSTPAVEDELACHSLSVGRSGHETLRRIV